MNTTLQLRKWVALTLGAAGLATLYFSIVRPWVLHWGATRAESHAMLAGDQYVLRPRVQATRAITIDAPVEKVWPWLAQLGQDRAGFYSYEILEDLAGCEMPRVTRLMPDRQAWKPGDALWMYPRRKLDGIAHAPLVDYEQGRHLVFVTAPIGAKPGQSIHAVWGFHLVPIGTYATRLIVRSRDAVNTSAAGTLFQRAVFEPMHFVMERKTMTEIRALAAGRPTSKAAEDAQVALWTIAFAWMLASFVQVARRSDWARPLAIAAAAAVVFQILTFLQPPLMLGAALVSALAIATWWRSSGSVPRVSGEVASTRRSPDPVTPPAGLPAWNRTR